MKSVPALASLPCPSVDTIARILMAAEYGYDFWRDDCPRDEKKRYREAAVRVKAALTAKEIPADA